MKTTNQFPYKAFKLTNATAPLQNFVRLVEFNPKKTKDVIGATSLEKHRLWAYYIPLTVQQGDFF